MSRSKTMLAAITVASVAAVPALPALDAPTPALDLGAVEALCVADIADAAGLVTDRAIDAAQRSTAAGLDIAVVIDPMVPPGIPYAVLDTPAGLCSVDTFNLTVAPTLGSPQLVASSFASVAAMQFLGDVVVRDVAVASAPFGDTVTLTTVGGRHSVTSRWTIEVDGLGVRAASFETTEFAAELDLDDLHGIEGITSREGHSRSWARDAAGLLSIDTTIEDMLADSLAERDAAAEHAARVAGLAPGDLLEGELDGQIIRYTLGFAGPTVETVPTGVGYADRLIYVRDGMQRIYDQFLGWGVTDVWDSDARTLAGFSTQVPDEVGYINFNSGFSAVCLACAFVGDFIEVHMEIEFNELIESPAFGHDYPDDNSSTLEVVGHEFAHTLQGGYGDGNVGLTNAFYEGTAVMSQSLFHEAENSNQAGSLEYGDNGNGCNGFENGRGSWLDAQAAGPFLDSHTYDACYFWWTFASQYGGPGMVALLEALPQVRGQGASNIDRHLLQLDLASPVGDGAFELAYWAAAYTARSEGDGYKIEDGSGDVHDWLAVMDELEPDAVRSREITPGQSYALTLVNGGTAGFDVTADGTIAALPEGARAFVFEVHDGHIDLVGPAAVGMSVTAGQIISVVAHTPQPVSGSVALT